MLLTNGRTTVDLYCAGSSVGTFFFLATRFKKERGYPLETRADATCCFSEVVHLGLVTMREALS